MTLANRSSQNAAAPNELDRAIANALRSIAQIINATRDTYDRETGVLLSAMAEWCRAKDDLRKQR